MNKQLPIGERIKKFRLSKGLSVKAFAEKYHLNKANLYKWEKGTRPSDYSDAIELEKILFSENGDQNHELAEQEIPIQSAKKDTKQKDLQNTSQVMETVQILAGNEKILCESNASLINIIDRLTANAAAQNHVTVSAIDPVVLELLLDFLQGKYKSKQEALAVYNRLIHAGQKKDAVKDIHHG